MTAKLYGVTPILLVENGKSVYKIIISADATTQEVKASGILQQYLLRASGAKLPVLRDNGARNEWEILVGHTNRSGTTLSVQTEGFVIMSGGQRLTLDGKGEKGVLYSVYAFLEQYVGCRKFSSGFTVVPDVNTIRIPGNLAVIEHPAFNYREVYYPDSKDQEYLDWHKLHRLDDSWGLWVHTFDKLVPSKEYFGQHPEYYALVDGKRKPSQLCLSNPEVFNILVKNLGAKIANDEGMKYWSVSQNDDLGYCECHLCRAADKKEGGPQGSLLKFVNKVATRFPNKIISTLAYSYSQKPPLTLKPAANVQIMLCSIDCNRSKSIKSDPRSASFRRDLKNWSNITPNLFVWDYTVQFTNYVSPFPNLRVLQSNIRFFKENGVKGIFQQGSGDTPGELSELRGYLLSKLSWNPEADVTWLTTDFLLNYYGKAAPFVQKYLDLLHNSLEDSGSMLDIYGNPVAQHNTYLSPELLDQYGLLFDQAEAAVESEPVLLQHVHAVRLPVEYAVLQQSRFYGMDKHGVFVEHGGNWASRPQFIDKVHAFVGSTKVAGITELSEGGWNPDQYQQEWDEVFKAGPKDHLGIHAKVTAITPFSEDYPNKGTGTLTDGSRGYLDYQYNWLGWYGSNMEVVLDLQKEMVIGMISTSFLEDQRHWAFPPTEVTYSVSLDGENFKKIGGISPKAGLYENYEKSVQDYTLTLASSVSARFVKVKAKNLKKLPIWRYYKGRKAWLFADEIMIR